MRKIFVLTGKRGGFGAMKPMLRLLRDDPNIELQLVVTDQHVSNQFGNTSAEIEKEFEIAGAVPMNQEGDLPVHRSRALGVCLLGMTDMLVEMKPDICVLYGDRGEVLVAAVAATTLGIPIAHLQGGDLTGSVDEQVRHAITKLAQLHFPSNKDSAYRIEKMGEENWRIHLVGDNHIDLITAGEFASREEVCDALNLDSAKSILIVLQHSETTSPNDSYAQMLETLIPVSALGLQTVVVYPCSDSGYNGIIKAIEEVAKGEQFRVFINLDAPIFWGLMSIADVLIGNSSAGIVEAASFHLPVINIGRRQEGRLHADNVLHVPHDRKMIAKALDTALFDKEFLNKVKKSTQLYGDGKAGARIVEILKNTKLDSRLMIKKMTY